MISFLLKNYSPLLNQEVSLTEKGEKITHTAIGARGEKIAAHYIGAEGGKVLYRNYRGPKGGEIDIIARDRNVLCFIEVKTRTYASKHSRPLDAVDMNKRRYMVKGAHAWLNLLLKVSPVWRYDVIEVVLKEGEKPILNWVKQAFTEDQVR